MKKKPVGTELKFEEALKRLETIVEEMEAGDVSLDDLLKKYEEGTRLSQFCQAKLGEAQQRIELLAKGKGGETKPFEGDDGDTQKPKAPEDADDDEDDNKLF